MSLKWKMPTFDRKDWVLIGIMMFAALWIEMMFVLIAAPSMPLLHVGEELPSTPPPEITIVFNFDIQFNVFQTEDGRIGGIIDLSYPLIIFILSATLLLVRRYFKWRDNRKPNSSN